MGTASRRPAYAIREVVKKTAAHAVLVELPSGRIVLASPSARQFLEPGGDPTGTRIEDYVAGSPTGALHLVADGTLDSYETRRRLRSGRSEHDVRAWVKALPNNQEGRTHALIVIETDGDGKSPAPAGEALVAVAGTMDYRLRVTHVTADVKDVLGMPPRDVLRRQFLDLFVYADALRVLTAIAEAARRNHSVAVDAHAQDANGKPVAGHLIVASLLPRPNLGFALLPRADPLQLLAETDQAAQLLPQVAASMRAADVYRRAPDVNDVEAELLSRLSMREVEIVGMLMRGDRVPAIARTLHLSQSTVRNQLSSVFRKFDVRSQQELIDRLRAQPEAGPIEPTDRSREMT